MNSQTPDNFDYLSAGKMQVVIALLAFMQSLYWVNIGRSQALSANSLSSTFMQWMDWTALALCVLAIIPLCRGAFLYRKGLQQQRH